MRHLKFQLKLFPRTKVKLETDYYSAYAILNYIILNIYDRGSKEEFATYSLEDSRVRCPHLDFMTILR